MGKLDRSLRQQWLSLHPEEKGTNPHFDRARNLLETQFFTGKKATEPDPIVYQAASRYLDIRSGITEDAAQTKGFPTASRYAGNLVVDELVSPPDDPELLVKVAKGVEMAKIALRNTLIIST